MAKKWLDNFKEKVSDWYNDSDQFYLRTLIDPVIELGRNIANSGQQLSEYVTPFYSDIMTGANMLEGGAQDIQNGKYLSGAGKVVAAPIMAAASFVVPDGADASLKATARASKLDEPLQIYTGKKLGEKAGRGRPASNVNEVTGDAITWRNILDAVKNNGRTVYTGTSEEAIKSMAKRQAIDKEAGYHAAVQSMDKKLSRKKAASETTRLNNTTIRQGISRDKSVLPKVTTYLKETLASGFTPSKKAIIKGDVDLAYQEWLEYLRKLQYDTKSKDSVQALNQIAEETWMKLFQPKKKQGGLLNYLILFS